MRKFGNDRNVSLALISSFDVQNFHHFGIQVPVFFLFFVFFRLPNSDNVRCKKVTSE